MSDPAYNMALGHMRLADRLNLSPFAGLLARLRRLFADADPGLLRLQLAARGTLSVGAATMALALASRLTGGALPDFAFGVVFSLVATFLLRDATRRGRLITLLALLPPSVAAVCATAFIHGMPLAGEALFLVLVFATSLMQAWHPRAMGIGVITIVLTYVGLYLELPPATLGWQVGGVFAGAAVVCVVCFAVLPLRPAATLRRVVDTVLRQAGAVLNEAERPSASPELLRHLACLTQAALAAEDQLVLLDEPSRIDVRLHLFALEQAVRQLVGLVALGRIAPGSRHHVRLRLTGLRLHAGRPRSTASAIEAGHGDPVAGALSALSYAASGLRAAARRAVAVTLDLSPAAPAPHGPLNWRGAAQVTLAALAAMLGGMALSPQRWFWAVIAAYVVFLNARSRGDAIQKGVRRLIGTLGGLFGGLGIALATADSGIAQGGAMMLAVFGLYYLYAVSYSAAIFCVTVLLGLIYGALGNPLEPLLLLRLEETALGVGAAMLAASFFLPIPTRQQVRLSGVAVLRSLRAVVAASVAEQGDGGMAAIASVRQLDRQLADLRLAMAPLTAGRFMLGRARAERPLTALLACADAARALAAEGVAADPATRTALAQGAEMVDRRIAALIEGGSGIGTPGFAVEAEPHGPALAALRRFDLSLAMLSERLEANLVDGFALD
jgi:uncharacterized membrane protein YccC